MRRIGQAHLGGNNDFAGQLGEELGALLVRLAFAEHDVLGVGVAVHRKTSSMRGLAGAEIAG